MSADRPIITKCLACGSVAYLPRPFCKVCGGSELAREALCGRGVVCAVTVVERAPSPELQALAPYGLCLVEADEGVRLMAQADAGLQIGDRVSLVMTDFAGRAAPRASRAEPP